MAVPGRIHVLAQLVPRRAGEGHRLAVGHTGTAGGQWCDAVLVHERALVHTTVWFSGGGADLASRMCEQRSHIGRDVAAR